ncbi:universal stress protein [Chloroflexota bacterium]
MNERILVPLDGSKVGEAALPYVEELISKLSPEVEVEITLFQVVSKTYYTVAGEAGVKIPYTEKEMEQIKRKATDYLSKVGEGLKSKRTTLEFKVEAGNAAEEIIKVADEINADLIAMSTHGRSGLSRWAFGSVTDRILRGGNKAVLVVRAVEKT